MNFDDLKLDFLMQSPDDLKGLISNRAIKCLKDDGHRTVFSAIRLSEKELLRIPNMGAKSVAQFIEIVSSHGFLMGDTAEFFEDNKDFFLCKDARPVAGYASFRRRTEKEIISLPPKNPDQIFIDDYRTRVKEFLNPSLAYQMRIQATINPQLQLETSYYISLLPLNLRSRITPEFARAAFHTMEVEAELSGPQEQLRQILIKAIERKLG